MTQPPSPTRRRVRAAASFSKSKIAPKDAATHFEKLGALIPMQSPRSKAAAHAAGQEIAILAMRVLTWNSDSDGRRALSYVEWGVLRYFRKAQVSAAEHQINATFIGRPRRGPAARSDSASSAARSLGIHPTTAVRALKALVDQGYLRYSDFRNDHEGPVLGYSLALTKDGGKRLLSDPTRILGELLDRAVDGQTRDAIADGLAILFRDRIKAGLSIPRGRRPGRK